MRQSVEPRGGHLDIAEGAGPLAEAEDLEVLRQVAADGVAVI